MVVPNLKPVIVSLAILNAITALKLFDYPYLITGGRPANSSEFLGTYIYAELFGVSRNYGYASALSILLLILALGVSIIMGLRARERTPRRTIKRRVSAMFETRRELTRVALTALLAVMVIPFSSRCSPWFRVVARPWVG